MKAIEVVAIVILVVLGIWLFGIILFPLIAFTLLVLWNLYRKYFAEPEQQPRKQPNWKCLHCGRINSPRAKICTKCGFERGWKKD